MYREIFIERDSVALGFVFSNCTDSKVVFHIYTATQIPGEEHELYTYLAGDGSEVENSDNALKIASGQYFKDYSERPNYFITFEKNVMFKKEYETTNRIIQTHLPIEAEITINERNNKKSYSL